jgi:hypothetical protein
MITTIAKHDAAASLTFVQDFRRPGLPASAAPFQRTIYAVRT